MNIVRGVISWLRRNPVHVGALIAAVVGILQALDVTDLTVEQVTAFVFVVIGIPAAVRTKVGTTSTGGWFKQ